MTNKKKKELMKNYFKEQYDEFIFIDDNIKAYVPDVFADGKIIFKQGYTNYVVVIDYEILLFEYNSSWYMGCFIDKDGKWFKPDVMKKILASGELLNDIKNKKNICGVRGFENYDTLEELLMGF